MKNKRLTSLVKMLSLGGAFLLAGCDNMVLLDPKGPVGQGEKSLILTATWLMLLVVVPVIIMTIAFAWRYRASNTKATYLPKWNHSTAIEATVWSIPLIIIAILAVLTWKSSHELDPYRPLDSDKKPMTIQVVSLDWKWLFIYPEQKIATVNELVFPKGVPVKFEITSGTVMNSFFIPQLGGQIYAMAGMTTQLHLQADEAGTYAGLSANYSGAGFSDMKFSAIATPTDQDFDNWVAKVKAGSAVLDNASYQKLLKPSENNPVEYFSAVKPQMYDQIVASIMHGSAKGQMHHEGKHEMAEEMGAEE
ncbi:ubiquinol oxidase subunit II [Gallaecimonas kandeliae]|uniref:ubiquinol oxidase subunit II n=1 Tax=Gallaecimonas kandeliae TaxID=3029055 RepID=UPI002648B4DF|nr:ubiquinol oxidase subunit II [Gallaecimonas kandeliae]WKE63914.1 ubiquinol oxidase subunit II [Gallaecimonas kandeliae]